MRAGACSTLKLHIYWHTRGVIFCPAVQFLADNRLISQEHYYNTVGAVARQYRLAVMRAERVSGFDPLP
jgi:hypothetical protein